MEFTIQAVKLTKSYGSFLALNQLDLLIGKGEVFGLLGANGAGKSTAVECILGTKKPDSGTASILGLDPEKDRKKLFERVGVQFQESCYQDKIRVCELCESTASLYKTPRNTDVLLEQLGLSDKKKHMINDLSGGQKQRLFIVLALIPDPEVIFLDELTTGLDVRARRDVWDGILDLKKKGLSIFLTSHSMDEVEALCDRIMILKKGKTVFYGTIKEAILMTPYGNLEDAYLYFTEEGTEYESL